MLSLVSALCVPLSLLLLETAVASFAILLIVVEMLSWVDYRREEVELTDRIVHEGFRRPPRLRNSWRYRLPFHRVTSWAVSPGIVLIWSTAGLGYAIRAGVGFYFAQVQLTSSVAIVGVACFAAYGIMFVLLVWVLEATSYCRTGKDGDWYALAGLQQKPHLGALLPCVGLRPKRAEHAGAGELPVEPIENDNAAYCGRYPILEERGRRLAPWNVALILSLVLGAILGTSLAKTSAEDFLLYLVAVASNLIGGVLLGTAGSTFRRLLIVLLTLVVTIVLALPVSPRLPLLMILPWLAIAGTYTGFRACSYRDLKQFVPDVKKVIVKGLPMSLRLLVGRQTAQRLRIGESGRLQKENSTSSENRP